MRQIPHCSISVTMALEPCSLLGYSYKFMILCLLVSFLNYIFYILMGGANTLTRHLPGFLAWNYESAADIQQFNTTALGSHEDFWTTGFHGNSWHRVSWKWFSKPNLILWCCIFLCCDFPELIGWYITINKDLHPHPHWYLHSTLELN